MKRGEGLETLDPDGRPVRLDGRGLRHVLMNHPELAGLERAIIDAVSRPDHRDGDPNFVSRERFYLRDIGPSRWLAVVVGYATSPARVVTAFGRRSDPASWKVRP